MLSQSTFVPAPRWAFFCRRKTADTLTITEKETRPETCYASLRCQIGAELGLMDTSDRLSLDPPAKITKRMEPMEENRGN